MLDIKTIDFKKLSCDFVDLCIYQGKIDKQLFYTLKTLAKPVYKVQLEKLWKEIVITRITTATISTIDILLYIPAVYLLSKQNIVGYLMIFITKSIASGTKLGLGNRMQDILGSYAPFFVQTLKSYEQERQQSSGYVVDTNEFTRGFSAMCNLERMDNIFMVMFINLGMNLYLLRQFFGIPYSITIIITLASSLTTAIVYILMLKTSKATEPYKEKISIQTSNSFKQTSKESFDITSHGKLYEYITRLTFIKATSNSLPQLIFALCTLLVLVVMGKVSLFLIIVLSHYLGSIREPIFWVLFELPTWYTRKRRHVLPFIKDLSTMLPSPLSLTSSDKFTSKIQSCRLENISYYGSDKELFNIQNMELQMDPGIYVVKGDSGEGKSIFMSILTGYILPRQGTVTYKTATESLCIRDINYWNLRDTVGCYWVSTVSFRETTTISLFRERLLETPENSKYLSEQLRLIDKLQIAQQHKNFIVNTVGMPSNQSERLL